MSLRSYSEFVEPPVLGPPSQQILQMLSTKEGHNVGRRSRGVGSNITPFIVLSLTAVGAVVWLVNSGLDADTKRTAIIAVAAAFLVVCLAGYFFRLRRSSQVDMTISDEIETVVSDPEKPLAELDEAREFFAGALRLADAFRLISNRVRDVMPFKAAVLYLLDERRRYLKIVHADGVSVEDIDDSLANQSYLSANVEVDSYLEMDSTQSFESSAAIPLKHGSGVLGVLQLYFGGDFDGAGVDKYLFEAVGERISPLILGSISYERTHAKALTDVTTDLPNERAFYLMLEKQIAESHNTGDNRPLTVLAIDVRNFDEINSRYGHAIGDQVLVFVARITRFNLRQMDFLARSVNDEFLAILPTAPMEVAHEIIERLHNAFRELTFDVSDDESIAIDLNIGWATYSNEGNTPGELLSFAELKKEQQKMPFDANVVPFPQEFVN